jgi:hypothetical protein
MGLGERGDGGCREPFKVRKRYGEFPSVKEDDGKDVLKGKI